MVELIAHHVIVMYLGEMEVVGYAPAREGWQYELANRRSGLRARFETPIVTSPPSSSALSTGFSVTKFTWALRHSARRAVCTWVQDRLESAPHSSSGFTTDRERSRSVGAQPRAMRAPKES